MTERKPEPELAEDEDADGRPHAHVTRSRLKGNGDISPPWEKRERE